MRKTAVNPAVCSLLETACPSIQYRIGTEILERSRSAPDMRLLQQQIIGDAAVQSILRWQQPDGWLGWAFHGEKSIEAGIRILREKGVEPHHPALAMALVSLEARPERLDRGIGKAGRILDEGGYCGSLMIQAAVLAYAGLEHKHVVRQQIQVALGGFQGVLGVKSIRDIAESYKDKLVFRPGVRWPSIYHLRLLAFTRGWRTAANHDMLTKAIQRLADLSPLPQIYVKHQSQCVAPASFAMQHFAPDMKTMSAADWMMWFHRVECLARLGVISEIPQLDSQVRCLGELLEQGNGYFPLRLQHPYFSKWGCYTGLMLERDWRSSRRRVNDLTFRSLLILHLAGSF